MPCAPLRILCNELNLIRTATLTPSSVMPAENTVLQTPAARVGTGGVTLTGAYTGSEAATLDVEILDVDADTKRASTPVLIGQGTGTLSGITASGGFAAQDVTVELQDAGIPVVFASIDFEGVKLAARNPGADGNDISVNVEQGIETSPAGLVFAATDYSLLADVAAGQGGPTTPLLGPGFDWGQPALGEDGVIPADAPRVAFGDDTSTVYLAYKRFSANAWGYYLVPALLRAVPKGTPIKFVSGGRIVTITDASTSPATVETYADVETVYDLLHQVKEDSSLVTVDGIVAFDRTPTGQAARDLLVRTDAHVEPSSGTGSRYATGVDSAFAAADASTELVTLRCYAVTGKDHPLAHLGSERWEVKASLSGALVDAITGVAYAADKFGFLIPRKLPPGYDSPKGSIGAVVSYATRATGESDPPICPVSLTLGADPSDQSVSFVYRRRPNGDCACDGLPVPKLSESCLGLLNTGDDDMTYSSDALTRLRALYDWAADLGAAVTFFKPGYVADGIPESSLGYTAPLSGSRSAGGTTLSLPSDAVVGGTTFPVDEELVSRIFTDYGLPADFPALVDAFEIAIQTIDELDSGAPKTAAWTKWDEALDAADTDMTVTSPQDGWVTIAVDKYRLMLRKALAYGGISPMGKSDASILDSGDGCWRDWGGSYWWEAQSGGYAPMFSNKPYISSRRAVADGKFYSTKEFGFQANIACVQDLKEGDTITIEIRDAARPTTYQVGDEITLPVVAAADLYLAGGQDGNSVQTWNVRGSTAGPLANYTLDTASPSAYSASGLAFSIAQGGISFVIGDRFTFSIEGGHFKWRVNGGAWSVDSPPLDIPAGSTLLYEGLSATFTPGAAPSFAAGDMYSFRILQPRAASNTQTPGPEAWQWVGSSATRVDDIGSVQQIAILAAALHTLPVGATLTAEGGTSPGVYTWTETLTRAEGPMVLESAAPQAARYIRWTIGNAPDATIGWLYAGTALTTELSADLNLSRTWKIDRGAGGLYQGGRYLGKAVSGEIEWTEGALPESDVIALQAMLDWVKSHDDEPIIIVPNVTRSAEAFLGLVAADDVEFPDISMYQKNADQVRRHETRIPVAGVWS